MHSESFFADTKRACDLLRGYRQNAVRSKAVSTIKHYANQIADFLYTKDVKMMVIACNTITATCLYDLQKRFPDIPIVGIINPAAGKIARTCDEDNRIGVIATKVTIASDDYNREIKKLNPNLHVFSKAAPAFVPLIEEGIIDNEIMDLTIKYYLDDFLSENKIDTLVLGLHALSRLSEKTSAPLSFAQNCQSVVRNYRKNQADSRKRGPSCRGK